FQALFMFTYPLIVDRELSGYDALKLSARAGLANFWGLVGFILLSALMQLLGMLACYIGAIFVMPIGFAMIVVAYDQVFPREDEAGSSAPDSGDTSITASDPNR